MVVRDRIIVLVAGIFLFGAAFGYTYVRFGVRQEPRAAPGERFESVVEEGAELVLRYVADGSIAWSEVIPVSEELVGLSLAEIRGLRPDWTVLSFAPTRLVVDVPCTVDEARGFIRERDGFVAIFSGDASGCYKLDELTDLEVPGLPPEAQEAVKKGIEFESRSDLPQILEGLTSTR